MEMKATKSRTAKAGHSVGRHGPGPMPRRNNKSSFSAQLRIDRRPSSLRIELKSGNSETYAFRIGEPATYNLSKGEERKLMGVLEQIGVASGSSRQRSVESKDAARETGRRRSRPTKPGTARKTKKRTAPKSIEDILARIAKQVPPEEWDKLPSDLSENVDHYLYGSPKR